MKKILAVALGALFMLGSVVTADAQAFLGTTEVAHGTQNAVVAASTVVKGSPGMVATVCVVVSAAAASAVYDATSTSGNTSANQMLNIVASTAAGTCYNIEMPAANGIVVAPGAGVTLSVFYR